jgi:NAD(P)H-hydrate repair Nnr-like enzyme with NAD(P)H-hydrate epimerase domain
MPPYAPAGVAEAKVADSDMAEKMSFVAGMGHPCGVAFHAAEHLKAHPAFAWQKALLRDLDANPWTIVAAAKPGAATAGSQ